VTGKKHVRLGFQLSHRNRPLQAGRLFCFAPRDLPRVQHFAAEVLELNFHGLCARSEREEEIVVLPGMEFGLRVFVEIAIAFQAGVEIRDAAGELGAVGEVAEPSDESAALAKGFMPCTFG
jgi:hypothetical protein